jgi:hypothetical protein
MMLDRGPISIERRVSVVLFGNGFSAHGPTATHRQSLAIAKGQLAALRSDLQRLVDADLAALEAKLDAAGVPWTPGRAVPAPAR